MYTLFFTIESLKIIKSYINAQNPHAIENTDEFNYCYFIWSLEDYMKNGSQYLCQYVKLLLFHFLFFFKEYSEIWIKLLLTLLICCCFFYKTKITDIISLLVCKASTVQFFEQIKNFLKYIIGCCGHCLYVAPFYGL